MFFTGIDTSGIGYLSGMVSGIDHRRGIAHPRGNDFFSGIDANGIGYLSGIGLTGIDHLGGIARPS